MVARFTEVSAPLEARLFFGIGELVSSAGQAASGAAADAAASAQGAYGKVTDPQFAQDIFTTSARVASHNVAVGATAALCVLFYVAWRVSVRREALAFLRETAKLD